MMMFCFCLFGMHVFLVSIHSFIEPDSEYTCFYIYISWLQGPTYSYYFLSFPLSQSLARSFSGSVSVTLCISDLIWMQDREHGHACTLDFHHSHIFVQLYCEFYFFFVKCFLFRAEHQLSFSSFSFFFNLVVCFFLLIWLAAITVQRNMHAIDDFDRANQKHTYLHAICLCIRT